MMNDRVGIATENLYQWLSGIEPLVGAATLGNAEFIDWEGIREEFKERIDALIDAIDDNSFDSGHIDADESFEDDRYDDDPPSLGD